MASDFDDADFVDDDFKASHKIPLPVSSDLGSASPSKANKPPTSEELGAQVSQTQQKLVELKRAQEELEQKRAALEEERRRQIEFQTGRQEMIQSLTRGVGLLEEAEFAHRRDAEQMAKTLAELRDSLGKVQSIYEEQWSAGNYTVELTRALTTIENARMEWNSARLKWPVLSGENQPDSKTADKTQPQPLLAAKNFTDLCKVGLAFTWPLALAALLAVVVLVMILLRR